MRVASVHFSLLILALLLFAGCAEKNHRAVAGKQIQANALLQKGEAVYRQNCISCHPLPYEFDLPSTSEIKPPPRNFAKEGLRYGSSRDAVAANIRKGIAGTPMPGYQKSLSEEDIIAVADYVLMLRSLYAALDDATAEKYARVQGLSK